MLHFIDAPPASLNASGIRATRRPEWLTIARHAFVGSTNYFDSSIRVDIEQDTHQFQNVRPVGSSPYLIDMPRMYVRDVRARMTQPYRKTGAPRWAPIPDSEILQAVRSYSDSTLFCTHRAVRAAGRRLGAASTRTVFAYKRTC